MLIRDCWGRYLLKMQEIPDCWLLLPGWTRAIQGATSRRNLHKILCNCSILALGKIRKLTPAWHVSNFFFTNGSWKEDLLGLFLTSMFLEIVCRSGKSHTRGWYNRMASSAWFNTLLLRKRDGHCNDGDQFHLFLVLLGALCWSRPVAPLRASNIFNQFIAGGATWKSIIR